MNVETRKAREGMILRSPVQDELGRVLLPAGELLTAKQLRKLAEWGIETLDVESVGAAKPAADPAPDPAFAARISARLDALFSGTMEVPLHRDLRALAEEHLLRRPELWDLLRDEAGP